MGMPVAHKTYLHETNRTVTGSWWHVSATDAQTGFTIEVGDLLFEGGAEITRITTFDEMLGCNKCNDAYHRDTRLGPFLHDEDGVRQPQHTKQSIVGGSSCKKYSVTGSEAQGSV